MRQSLPGLRRRAETRPLTPNSRRDAGSRIKRATEFLAWLDAHDRDLRGCAQADLDRWHAEHLGHERKDLRPFLQWAMRSHRMPRLDVPRHEAPQQAPITQHHRLGLLRRLLTDDTAPLRTRVAAVLTLLYAQPLSRIVRLTTSDIITTDDHVLVRFGDPLTPVPPPFADLLLELTSQRTNMRTATNPNSTWLFPGRRAGQPLRPEVLGQAIRDMDLPTVLGAPPPYANSCSRRRLPSSRTCSASTPNTPPASTPTRAAPGPATHPAHTPDPEPGPTSDRTPRPATIGLVHAESPRSARAAVTARGLFDYREMFVLDPGELSAASILDCPVGASPFGAQARARGGTVTSVDPIYDQSAETIVARVRANLDNADAWLSDHAETIDWSYLGSTDAHIRASEVAADLFATDYTAHREDYRAAGLPELPFPDQTFDLTLSANLLFVYPEVFNVDAHIAALLELCRVTRGEVRVHPVCDITAARYAHFDHVRAALADHDIATELRSDRFADPHAIQHRRRPTAAPHPAVPPSGIFHPCARRTGLRPEPENRIGSCPINGGRPAAASPPAATSAPVRHGCAGYMNLEALAAEPLTVAIHVAHLAPAWRRATNEDPPETISGRGMLPPPGTRPGDHRPPPGCDLDAPPRRRPPQPDHLIECRERAAREGLLRSSRPGRWPRVSPRVVRCGDRRCRLARPRERVGRGSCGWRAGGSRRASRAGRWRGAAPRRRATAPARWGCVGAGRVGVGASAAVRAMRAEPRPSPSATPLERGSTAGAWAAACPFRGMHGRTARSTVELRDRHPERRPDADEPGGRRRERSAERSTPRRRDRDTAYPRDSRGPSRDR